jgi:uncharacterized protein (TIGR00661 family)
MIGHLQEKGHRVKVVTYDRGVKNLQNDFDVFETEGLHINNSDNKVSVVKTFTDNIRKLSRGHKKLQALRHDIFKKLKPDCVITDFEPMTAYLANHYDIPLITIDNQHRMRYMEYPCPPKLQKDRLLTENIIRAMVPKPDVSLITTFYFGQMKNERSFCFPPILRSEVLSLKPEQNDYILVYLTGGFGTFVDRLEDFKREQFIVYGHNEEGSRANLAFKPPSRDGFLRHLAGCKAVMATAGFTLMTESLHLRKPYLALPMRGQFEQELNGYLLAQLGYGVNVRKVSSMAVSSFLYHVQDYAEELQSYTSTDNSAIMEKLDALLADNCALAKEFHFKRST